jgi:hypothetical protein
VSDSTRVREVLTSRSPGKPALRGAITREPPGDELADELIESPAIRRARAAFERAARARAAHLVRADLGTLLRLRQHEGELEEAIWRLTDGERTALMEETTNGSN